MQAASPSSANYPQAASPNSASYTQAAPNSATYAQSSQAASPSSTNNEQGICRFWLSGHCRQGSSCKYSHDRSIRSSLAGARAPRTAPKMPSKQPKSSKPKQKARSWKKALLPCRNWQQGECRRGNSCTFGHDQRYLNLNTAQIAEQNRTSQPLPSSSHALASADICSTDLGDQSSKLTHEPPAVDSQGICRNWLKRHYCTSRSSCRFAHPPDQFPFPSFFINIIDDVIFLFIF